MITVSLCLSDIPKERIYTGKNGKKYLTIVVSEMKEPDKYENTHTCYISQKETEKGQPKEYIGKGRERVFNNEQKKPYTIPDHVTEETPGTDDLPF